MAKRALFCGSEDAAAGVARRWSRAEKNALAARGSPGSLTEGGFVILDRTFMDLSDMLDRQTRAFTARKIGGEHPLACLRPERTWDTWEVDSDSLQRNPRTGGGRARRFAAAGCYRDDEMVDAAGTLTAGGRESDAARSAG